jgi:hypothetical protein
MPSILTFHLGGSTFLFRPLDSEEPHAEVHAAVCCRSHGRWLRQALQRSEQPPPLRLDLCNQSERAVQAHRKGCHLAGSVLLVCGANVMQLAHICTDGWCMHAALIAQMIVACNLSAVESTQTRTSKFARQRVSAVILMISSIPDAPSTIFCASHQTSSCAMQQLQECTESPCRAGSGPAKEARRQAACRWLLLSPVVQCRRLDVLPGTVQHYWPHRHSLWSTSFVSTACC